MTEPTDERSESEKADAPESSRDGATFSHPDKPVRHSYPLAIRQAGFFTALGLLNRTMPYALVRFAILLAVSIITIIWAVLTFGGFAVLGTKIHPFIGYGWLFAGIGVYGYIWWVVVRYGLYVLKCGHIAVLTELVTTNSIGNGEQGMFSYGKEVVTKRFGEVNVLFGIDLLIAGVVKAFNRTLDFIGSLLPIPGLSNLMQVVNAIISAATTYIDETLFSYNLARGDENPWRSGRDGLIYYCQNAKEVLKTAVGVVILDKVLTILLWAVMLVPAVGVAWIIPGQNTALWPFFIAVLFAWNIRAAFLKPIFLIMIMTKFHVSVEGQEINEEWDERLTSVSGKFVKIKDGIADWINPKPATPAAEADAAS